MKALIVSDSHGSVAEIARLKQVYAQEVDILIHCGDSELSAQQPELQGYQVVKGNCDFGGAYPNEMLHEIDGVRIFVTHGHLYNVKYSLQTLLYRAQEQEAHVVCFGHSHVMGVEMIDGVLFINPGSILLPRGRKEKTYALLEVTDKEAAVTFYEADGKQLSQYTFERS